jgi:ribonuclease HI
MEKENVDLRTETKQVEAEQEQPMWNLYVDGAASEEGCGAGLLLQSPNGNEFAYALRFDFKATNNEAEYEALVAGLNLAQRMRAQRLKVHSDSQIVIQQVKGTYEARDARLKKYFDLVQRLVTEFEVVEYYQIPRSQNKKADALSKLASSPFSSLNTKVLVEVLPCRSTESKAVNTKVETEVTWMTPIWEFLTSGTLPSEKVEARKLQLKAPKYVIQDGVMYKRAYLQPLLRCIGPRQAEYVLREIPEWAF